MRSFTATIETDYPTEWDEKHEGRTFWKVVHWPNAEFNGGRETELYQSEYRKSGPWWEMVSHGNSLGDLAHLVASHIQDMINTSSLDFNEWIENHSNLDPDNYT